MANPILEEQQIQADVDHLRTQFPQTRELYREVCTLLFFRYGITPTANKLYQYVKKGSMSAPAEALNKFWLELREKSRIRIDHPDIPENVQVAAGELISSLWSLAQEAAAKNYAALNVEAQEKVRHTEIRATNFESQLTQINTELSSTHENLQSALQAVQESEKKHAVDTSTLLTLQKSLLTLQNERDQIQKALEHARTGFSQDLDKVNIALAKAEDRYHALEARSLMEIDRERQHAAKAEKDVTLLKKEVRGDHQYHKKELMKLNGMLSKSRELIGELSGQLSMSRAQQKKLEKEIKALTLKFQKELKKDLVPTTSPNA